MAQWHGISRRKPSGGRRVQARGKRSTEISTEKQMALIGEHHGIEVHETKVTAEFAMSADEAFCCGTAAVISPIGTITKGETKATYGDGQPGEMTQMLYNHLVGIQNETKEDIFGWLHEVPL